MKKQLVTFLVLFLATMTLSAQKSGKCGDNLTWTLDNGTLVISGVGDMTDYTSMNIPWMMQRGSIKTIIVREGVTSIGAHAFFYCNHLISCTLPGSLVYIERNAFRGCDRLKSITIPYGVKRIENFAFKDCSDLASIYIPVSVELVDENAFADCSNIAVATVASKATTIHPKAFDKITRIKYDTTQPQNTAKSGNPAPAPVNDGPALLIVVPRTLKFNDESGNNAIDANEQCSVTFQVRNIGKGTARNCVAKITSSGATAGLTIVEPKIPSIGVDESKLVTIPITASQATVDGELSLSIYVDEPNGFGTDPIQLTVPTRAFAAPMVQVVDYTTKSESGTIAKKVPFTLKLMVQNTQSGEARDVQVELVLPNNVMLMTGEKSVSFPFMEGGEVKPLEFELIANNHYTEPTIPIQVKLREKYGKYAEDKPIIVNMNQASSAMSLVVAAAEEKPKQDIRVASIRSAVDKNIPVTKEVNKKTFVVVIANENYQQVENVRYALNDGEIFAQYCQKTLGVPERNIHVVTNATKNNIVQQVNWLTQVMAAYEGDAKVIFYYAGHGVPDESSRTAYLLPIDGSGSDITTGYKLDDLYQKLGSLESQSVTVILDACFSGSRREDGMLASARGVAIKPKSSQPVGNMVVFSAATGDETAYPNDEEGHGMFTYYLLKKLQETGGDVTYEELTNYVRKHVSQESIVQNGKSQTPTVSASAAGWQNWKMK